MLSSDGIGRVLSAWVGWILGRRWLTIAAFFAVAGASLAYAYAELGIETDTTNMISPELPWRQDYIAYRDRFPFRDRNLVVVIESPIADAAERYAADLAARLEAAKEHFTSVFFPADDEFFRRHGLLYLELPSLLALGDRLVEAQPLLGRLQGDLGGAALIEMLVAAQQRGVDADTENLTNALTEALERAVAGAPAWIAWSTLFRDDIGPSPRQLVLLEPQLDPDLPLPAARAIERLREEIAALHTSYEGLVEARVTGTLAMEHEELLSVGRGVGSAGLGALVLVALVLWAALRSFKLLVLALLTLVSGLAVTAAFAAGTVGELNLLSVAFAVLYVGLGVDFLLHIALRLRELAPEAGRFDEALIESVSSIGPALLICAVTTMAGFYSFVPTPFRGVSELGLIAGTGMLIGLFTSVTLFPALIGAWLGPHDLKPLPPRRRGIGQRLLARPRAVIAVTALLAGIAAWSLPAVRFDNNPIHLRDPDSESVAAIRDLAADGSALPMQLVAMAPDARAADGWAAALAASPLVRDVRGLADWVPEQQAVKLEMLGELSLLLGPGFGAARSSAEEPGRLTEALDALQNSLAAAMDKSDAGRRLEAAVGSLRTSLARDSAQQAAARLAAIDRELVAFLPEQLERLEQGLGAGPVTAADLPAALRERYVAADGHVLLEVTPAENTYDNEAAARFVAGVRDIVPTATGLPVVHQEASATVISAFRQAFTYASVLVVVMLWLFSLHLRDTLLVLGSVLLAALVTAGSTVWIGIDFNFANIIALPLLLGLGVDYGIHVVERAKRESLGGTADFGNSTSRAVLASGLTTIASFGNLAFSPHLGMASMGQLLTLGMLAALAASLWLLPALLLVLRRR